MNLVCFFKEMIKARDFFNQVSNQCISPQVCANALFFSGLCSQELKQYLFAEKGYSALIAGYPDSVYFCDALKNLGDIYLVTNQLQKAVDTFKMLAKSSKDKGTRQTAVYNLGWAYFRMGEYKSAIRQFEYLGENGVGEVKQQAILRLGDIFYNMHEYHRAIEYYVKLQGTSYKDIRKAAIYGISQCFFQKGDFVQFRKWVGVFTSEFPNDRLSFVLREQLSEIEASQGNLDSALKLLISLEGQVRGKDAAAVYLRIAEIYERKKNTVTAFQQLSIIRRNIDFNRK